MCGPQGSINSCYIIPLYESGWTTQQTILASFSSTLTNVLRTRNAAVKDSACENGDLQRSVAEMSGTEMGTVTCSDLLCVDGDASTIRANTIWVSTIQYHMKGLH